MKPQYQYIIESEFLKPNSFHSDINELFEVITPIYKSREGIIHPKFGFCKDLICSNNMATEPITIYLGANDKGIDK
jgi:hypothetical protein